MAKKEKTIFQKFANTIEVAYDEYGYTNALEEIILNGFKGINNMTEEEQIKELKRLQLPKALKWLKKWKYDENFPHETWESEIEFTLHFNDMLTKEELLIAWEEYKERNKDNAVL